MEILSNASITVEDNVEVDIPGIFRLQVVAAIEPSFEFLNPLWRDASATGTITVGDAEIEAGNIELISAATTDKFISLNIFDDGLPGLLTGGSPVENDPATRLGTTFSFADTDQTNPTITRSQGNWILDGFSAGMEFKIIGTLNNAADSYTIESVTDNRLTLIETNTLFPEDRVNLQFKQIFTDVISEDIPLVGRDREGNPVDLGDATGETIKNALLLQLQDSSIIPFDLPVEAAQSDTTSTITVQSGAVLRTAGHVTINASALTDIGIESPGMVLGAVYGNSRGVANTTIADGAEIDATGNVDIRSSVDNRMLLSLQMNSGAVVAVASSLLKIPGGQIGVVYGKGFTETIALVAEGATVRGDNITVDANSLSSFELNAKAVAKPSGGIGGGIGVAVSDVDSKSTALIAGTIVATGDVTVDSTSKLAKHDVEANAIVRSKPKFPLGKVLGAVKNKFSSLPFNPQGQSAKVDVAAGVAFVDSVNEAFATVGSQAQVQAGGNMTVTALAEDNFRSVAIGAAKAASQFSLGGAVAVTDHDNFATAKLDAGAIVDVFNELSVTAEALVPNQESADEDLDAVLNIQINDPTFDGEPVQAFEDLDSFVESSKNAANAVGRLAQYVTNLLTTGTNVGTSYTHASAQASNSEGDGKFAVSGGVTFVTVDNKATALIGEAALVNTIALPAAATQNVRVKSKASIDSIHISGLPSLKTILVKQTGGVIDSKSDGSSVGGYYLDLGHNNTSHAYIADGAVVNANQDVEVDADSFTTSVNLASAGSQAGKIGVSGAFVFEEVDHETLAWIGNNATVSALGTGNGQRAYTGDKAANGNRLLETVRGVNVVAVSWEDIQSIGAGGQGGGKVGLAGAATVNVLKENTKAWIDSGAVINSDLTGASTNQDVLVRAADDTNLYGVAGGVAAGGSAGIGAGVDVGTVIKVTEAYVAPSAHVKANANVIVEALNQEEVDSLTAALGAGGSAGIAGSSGVHVFDVTTRAYVGAAATVHAQGSVLVRADDQAEFDILAGSVAASGNTAVGASAGVPVVLKTTEAYIAADAIVDALALRAPVTVATGDFTIGQAPQEQQHDFPTADADGNLNIPDLEIGLDAPEDRDLDDDGQNDLTDPSFFGQRIAIPLTKSFSGVSVTAITREDIENIGASGGAAGTVAVNIGGSLNVADIATRAYIDTGAEVNLNDSGADSDQSVNVAAGTDYYHFGTALAASLSGTVSVTPGATIAIANFVTEASINDGATVEARRDVDGMAVSRQDFLNLVAGVAASGNVSVAGSLAVDGILSTTRAFIGEHTGADVGAGGNVLVLAQDETDIDVVAGSLSIGIGAAGVGASVGATFINKRTDAFIGADSIVDALAGGPNSISVINGNDSDPLTRVNVQGLAVQAISSENVLNAAIAGAVGFYAGVAGGNSVDIIDSDTQAFIGASALVNQSGGAQGDQAVAVGAANDSFLLAAAGGAGGGLVGIGGGVDLGAVRNDTRAFIDTGATVSARDDIYVAAAAHKDIKSFGLSASAGVVAASGSISVWSLGAEFVSSYDVDDTSENALDTSEDSDFGSVLLFIDAMLAGDDPDPEGNDANNNGFGGLTDGHRRGNTFHAQSAVNGFNDTIDLGGGHGYETGDAVTYRAGSGNPIGGLVEGKTYYIMVDPTNAILVRLTTSRFTARQADEQAQEGLLPTSRVNIFAGTASRAEHRLEPLVGDTTAQVKRRTDGYFTRIIGSVASALGAGLKLNTLPEGTIAFIGQDATVSSEDSIFVRADEDLEFLGFTGSAAVGGGSLGASITIANVKSNVDAFIDDRATVNAGSGVTDRIEVIARFDEQANAIAFAGSAGGIAMGAQVAVLTDESVQNAHIDNSVQIDQAGGGVLVEAEAEKGIAAQATGGAITIGLAAAGAGIAIATGEGETNAFVQNAAIGDGTNQVASLTVTADNTTHAEADAHAVAGGVGLLALSGSYAKASAEPTILAAVANDIEIQTAGDVTIESLSDSQADALALGASVSIGASLGVSVAEATAEPNIRTRIGRRADVIAGGDIAVTTDHTGLALSRATTPSGGLIAGSGAISSADAVGDLATYVDLRSSLDAGNDVLIQANATHEASATADGLAIGALGVGGALARANVDQASARNTESELTAGSGKRSENRVYVEDGTIDAGGSTTIAARYNTDSAGNPTANLLVGHFLRFGRLAPGRLSSRGRCHNYDQRRGPQQRRSLCSIARRRRHSSPSPRAFSPVGRGGGQLRRTAQRWQHHRHTGPCRRPTGSRLDRRKK